MKIDQALGIIETWLGLHQRLGILYVVDGYQAVWYNQDGQEEIYRIHGKTIDEAIIGLAMVLE